MASKPSMGTRGGKSVEPTAALGKPSSYPSGIRANGASQAATVNTTSDGGSNLETLRQGSKPKPEAVRVVAQEDPGCLAKARKYAARSEHGGAEPMAASQKVNE